MSTRIQTQSIAPELLDDLRKARRAARKLEEAIHVMFHGQHDFVRHVLVALFARGSVIATALPGRGKTTLFSALGRAVFEEGASGEKLSTYHRISCTPDMGNPLILWSKSRKTGQLRPSASRAVKRSIVLIDEINRTPPKTQAQLLEPMQEGVVTVSLGSITRQFDCVDPWFACATQNPLEQDGTYPLPEAQLDRFMFGLDVALPDDETLRRIFRDLNLVSRNPTDVIKPVLSTRELRGLQTAIQQIPVSDEVEEYAIRLVLASHREHPSFPGGARITRKGGGFLTLDEAIETGASPRVVQALALASRAWAVVMNDGDDAESFLPTRENIQELAVPLFSHRVFTTPKASRVSRRDIIRALVRAVPVDPARVVVSMPQPASTDNIIVPGGNGTIIVHESAERLPTPPHAVQGRFGWLRGMRLPWGS